MGGHESLSLIDRFKLPHASLSLPRRFMRLLGTIILILLRTMDRLGYQLSVGNTITAQFIRNDLSGFTAMAP
jgi:hypothetical protein